MSNLSEALARGEFLVTGEIGPPKGTNIEKCLEDAEHLRGKVTAINVTDIQSAVMRFGGLATCHMLVERDLEPVFQMVCRDRNRLALQSDLLSAHVLGIENVLCLTGDHNILGDHPDSKPVFDLEAVGLLQCVQTLMEGRDMAGNELDGAPPFFPGAVVAPGSEPVEMQIIRMEKKIAAGAKFFQTQAVYDVDQFADFMGRVEGFGVPVLCGLVLLKSVGMARFMNANVSGVNVPDRLIARLKADKEKTKSGEAAIEIAVETIEGVKDLCQGVHIMPLGWDHLVPDIIDRAGLA
ncbi:MAG: methylenetetrahydrofolate reductase [Planctomycetes bacterium SM23_32]|nr:MAG: methylenetetrahydrofolate reductase [Planctomycetes bacterium SM23_32]